MIDVVLERGRDRSVRRRHPWILSGSVARVEGDPTPGAWVRVRSAEGEILGHGHLSPRSSLRVRLLVFGKDPPAEALLEERIRAALERRAQDPLLADCDALRLVNAEGDGLPGLIVDRYADTLVLRISSAGMALRRDALVAALRETSRATRGIERADAVAARQEGIPVQEGVLWGDAPQAPLGVRERERRYRVDVVHGQKTGFYLDQRDARDLVQLLARDRRMLDLFCYSGAFAVAAARGGARSVTLVDSSEPALELARLQLAENSPQPPARIEHADAFDFVRRDDGRYDLLVLDPPPLARRRHEVQRAARAYKDVLLHALRRADPGALVLTFCCSHHVGPDLFRKIAFGACLDAGRPAQVLRSLGAPVDHPVSIDHPEGGYLTGLLLRV